MSNSDIKGKILFKYNHRNSRKGQIQVVHPVDSKPKVISEKRTDS